MSIIEILVCVVVVSALTLTIVPALASMRSDALNEMSKANLMQFGQGRDQYALENKDRIFSYSWRAGEPYMLPTGQVKSHQTDLAAAQWQNTEILQRRTGRITGVYKVESGYNLIPHRRFTHLVLLDDMNSSDQAFLQSRLGIDPADENLLTWHERPLEYRDGSGVPYADVVEDGYDDNPNWARNPTQQRWAFSSSYQVVPHAWQGDGRQNVYVPTEDSPHLFFAFNGNAILGRRHLTEVAFPSKKVHMHEEFDYEQNRLPYFAYDHARPEKLMFDGSINSRPSGEANGSVSPTHYDLNHPQDPKQYIVWTQFYVPLDTFPIQLGGFGEDVRLNMRYRWTLFGLQGVDYE